MRFKPRTNGIWNGKHPHSSCYIQYSKDDHAYDILSCGHTVEIQVVYFILYCSTIRWGRSLGSLLQKTIQLRNLTRIHEHDFVWKKASIICSTCGFRYCEKCGKLTWELHCETGIKPKRGSSGEALHASYSWLFNTSNILWQWRNNTWNMLPSISSTVTKVISWI